MIGIIAAVSSNGVVGKNGKLSWSYPEDLKYFKSQTLNSTIIMGRSTFESMGSKPLPKRTNIVVSSQYIKSDNIIRTTSLDKAILAAKDENIWLIGGTNIWRDGMKYADKIYLTLIPETIEGDNLTYFPWVSPYQFDIETIIRMPCESSNSKLKVAIYNKL